MQRQAGKYDQAVLTLYAKNASLTKCRTILSLNHIISSNNAEHIVSTQPLGLSLLLHLNNCFQFELGPLHVRTCSSTQYSPDTFCQSVSPQPDLSSLQEYKAFPAFEIHLLFRRPLLSYYQIPKNLHSYHTAR